jgi:PAS domain S-box-containing protein
MDTTPRKTLTPDDFRSIISTSIDGFLLVDMSGAILEVNESYCRLVGYTRDQLLTMHTSAVEAFDSVMDESKRSEVMRKEGSLRFETRHLHKGGTIIDVEVSANYVASNGGLISSFIRDISHRKQIEKELCLSEEHFRNIIETQTEFVDRYLPGGILIYVNHSLARFAGMEPEALIGKSFYPFIHEDDREDTVRGIESLCSEKPSVITKNRIVLPDGSLHWNQWTHTGIFDEQGTLIEYQSVGKDITAHKAAEEALKKSEEKYRNIFQYAAIGIFHSTLEDRFIDVNPALARMMGYDSPEEAVNSITSISTQVYAAPRQRDTVAAIALEAGGVISVENLYRRKDGTLWNGLLHLRIIFDQQGKPSHYEGFVDDITERYQRESALKESELRFRSVMENIPSIAVQGYSLDGKVTFWNRASEILYGFSAEEALGANLLDLIIPPEMRAGVIEAVGHMKESGEPIPASELLLQRKDGSRVPVFSSHALLHSHDRQPELFCLDIDLTELKRIEEALRKSEEKFSKAFKASPEAIVLTSMVDGTYVEVNDVFLERTGLLRDEVIGHTSVELNFWIDANERQQFLATLSRNGSLKNHEVRFRIKNNEIRYFLISSEVIEIEGNPCSLNFIIDTTERKKAQDALAENQKFLSDLIENSGALVYAKDYEGHIQLVNRRWEEVTGFNREDVLGKKDSAIFPEAISKQFRDNDLQVMERGTSVEMEEILEDESGKRYFLSSKFPMRDLNNKVKGICGMSADITDRKRMEEALRESEYFFKESQRAAHIGSYRADFIKDHWTSSEILDAIFGIDQDYDRSVQGWLDLIHPDDCEMMARYLREEVITKRNPFAKEYRIIRKRDGEPRWVHGFGEAIFAGNGSIITLAGTIQDITERKLIEHERAEIERQLLQAQKLESLGVLAGGIAHDFNNLLAVIIGHCSLAKLIPKTALDSIAPIEKAAERAAELCRQMLAYAGKTQHVEKEVNISELVDEMVKMLKSTINQNVVITYEDPADIPPIKADASQIRQIVMNLIINASEAIGETQGEVRITLETSVVRTGHSEKDYLGKIIPPGSYISLEVADNGCGMDAETKQRLFEPFYTTKFTGRGLGMSATLGIITAHKGALQLSSQPGTGTTFKVFLPVLMGEPAEEHTRPQNISPDNWQGSGTILLVEDEELVEIIAESMLNALGFTVIKASNGREALELYLKNTENIMLVVTDLGMPVMDGYAFIRELKKLNPYLPVIISSGFGDTDITSRIPAEDVAGIVGKPYSFDRFRDVVKNVVEGIHAAPGVQS